MARTLYVLLGPVLAVACYFLLISLDVPYLPAVTAAITLLTVVWWITEALPIPATSIVPFVLLPLSRADNHRLTVALILGIAYAASLGGVGSPLGTPPNVIFMGIYEEFTGREFSFLSWMKIGLPVVLLTLPLMALWLTRGIQLNKSLEAPPVGEWRPEEVRTLLVFAVAILFWVTRNEPFGGWSGLLGVEGAGDSTVALGAVVLMFLIPNGKGGHLLDWPTAESIPWGMLLLFAGGIAIAKGFVVSGLSDMMGQALVSLTDMPLWLMLVVLCLSVTFLTEITSNTATATLLMPILAVVATSVGLDPMVLMIPAAMCASCAFMLPVATAPNAIAYGTGKVRIQEMVREGAVLSVLASLVIAGVCGVILV